MTKRTPLYEEHRKLNARFTEFGGWEMPVQYTSIMDEHTAVRTAAGLFDTSHMGTFIVGGPQAVPFLDALTVSDAAAIAPGQAKYSLLLNERGGVIDDLILYRRPDDFLVVVNAGNRERDYAWFERRLTEGATLKDISSEICLLALQGPRSQSILQPLVREDLSKLGYYRSSPVTFKAFSPSFSHLARTGYTGEDGFEIFISTESAPRLWESLIAAGAKPCGLGARDTLRLEAGMPLHGHEISEEISPLEAGLAWTISWDKDFIGKSALLEKKKEGISSYLVAFAAESGIPRAQCAIQLNGRTAGTVTSGTYSPTLKKGIGLGYIDRLLPEGAPIDVVVHGQPKRATVVRKPFYKRPR